MSAVMESEVPGVRPARARFRVLDWWVILGLTAFPTGGTVAALVFLLWQQDIGLVEVGTLVTMYIVTGLGISVGFHRLLTHRAFETGRVLRVLLSIAGSMAAQRSAIEWAAIHRRHHMFSDEPGDPHSPLGRAGSLLGLLRGLWHAQVGWLLVPEHTSARHYAPDLLQDRAVFLVSRLYFVWVFLGLALPALAGWLLTGTWLGAWQGFLWGGLVRAFLMFNATGTVNSLSHVFGRRPFPTDDGSRNNVLVALVAFGEGWHNNHHAFPTSAPLGLRWWQLDLGFWLIRALECVGLAWNVKRPTAQQIEAKLVKDQGPGATSQESGAGGQKAEVSTSN
jgi:stearoyl-CoA desaturase (Delta-9 desaturase)